MQRNPLRFAAVLSLHAWPIQVGYAESGRRGTVAIANIPVRSATPKTNHDVRSISNTERTPGPSARDALTSELTGADAGRLKCPYEVRLADPSDAQVLAGLEQEAFPELDHPTRFRRELQRANSTYFVAKRRWRTEERRNARWGKHPSGDKELSNGLLSRVRQMAFWLMTQRPSTLGGQRDPDYIGGFAGIWFVLDEAHVVIIASRPSERRRGVGELLLITCLELALQRKSRIVSLEVRASNNAARSLYGKYGFQDAGVRKRYYSGGEDAIIMSTPPIQSEHFGRKFRTLVDRYEARWGKTATAIV